MNSSPESDAYAVSLADVDAAVSRLAGVAVRTPLLESPLLNEELGFRLLIKAETLQRTGSFKFRGAYNAIAQLSKAARKAGVVAFSSGNHAQGVAAAASLLGAPATIVMPSDAPRIKLENTRAWGAKVMLYDRMTENREAIGAQVAEDNGAVLVKPYDDAGVIAGQATVGVEIAEQAREAGFEAGAVAVPCSGGGLSSGIALALSARSPDALVWTAEPEAFDDTARSLAAGRRITAEAGAGPMSICDALLTPEPGALTFPILKGLGARGLAVSDESVKRAMATAFNYFKLVVEPGGAAALAAVLNKFPGARDKPVICVCSGGNADPAAYAEILRDFG